MRLSRIIILLGFFISFNFYCSAQQGITAVNDKNLVDTFENHLKASLISYYRKYPQEKVFIHTNQEIYDSGGTIWYKIYAIAYGKPTALSRIVYVQLTDSSGNVIAQNKLPLLDGKAHGNIDISQKIKTGWYNLSAFTSWMMNFDHEAYYRQQIFISNPADSATSTGKKEVIKKAYHVIFDPEGGNMVDGNLTKIAFRAYRDDGLPAQVNGVIKDNSNKTLEKFSTIHDGMGEFTIEAFAGRSYSATVYFPDGSSQTTKLPEVQATGISLQVSQTLKTIHVKLAFTGPKEKYENCLLAAFQNNGQLITCPLQLLRGINEFDLQKAGFSTGIVRLTVFDHDGLPQAERILFINKHDLQTAVLKTDTLSFLPGGLNSFSTIVKDETGRPVKGDFSVAVTDGDAFKHGVSQNIFSALLLSPELKGEIYDPGYYFKNESDSLARQLDLVMLTNGWRHFSWRKILNNEDEPIKYTVERSPYIAGEINDYKTLMPGKDKVKLLIVNQDSTKFIGYASPDSNGMFIIKDFNHTGISDVYMQSADNKNRTKKFQIKLFPTLDDSLKRTKADKFEAHAIPDLSEYFISHVSNDAKYRLMTGSITLNTVNIKEKKASATEKLIAEHVSAKYESDREYTLDLVNNPTLNIGLVNYLRGRFPNLQITGDNNSPAFIYRGGNTLKSPGPPLTGSMAEMASDDDNGFLPSFYLNETPVQYSSIKDISLIDVALIRFMPPPVWFAPYNGGNAGAIMIYTKKQSDEVRKMAGISEFDHYIFNGFNITREFSAPDYSKPSGQIKANDNRLTLYWDHDIDTDNDGVLKFKFFNSDAAKKFKVIIQGMDTQGRLVYLQHSLQ